MNAIVGRMLFMVVIGLIVFPPVDASACATCFGASDEPMAKGMNMGIFSLLLVIMTVMVGIAVFFLYIIRRASRMQLELTSGGAPQGASTVPAAGPISQ